MTITNLNYMLQESYDESDQSLHQKQLDKKVQQIERFINKIKIDKKSEQIDAWIKYILLILVLIFILAGGYAIKENGSSLKLVQKNIVFQQQKIEQMQKQIMKLNKEILQLKSQQKKEQNLKDLIQQIDNVLEVVLKQHKRNAYNNRLQQIKSMKLWQFTPEQQKFLPNLIKHNIVYPWKNKLDIKKDQTQKNQIRSQQYEYYEKKYSISQIKSQLPFCIIVPSWNNAVDQRYELNLNSLLNQNYTNFKIHIIDDFSSDQTYHLIKRYLRQKNITSDKVTIQRNKQRGYGVKNIIQTARKYCHKQDIISVVDGDDQLVGTQVLKLFNYFYSKSKLGVAWSNLIAFNTLTKNMARGISGPYKQQQIQAQSYRDRKADGVHMQLRTFKGQLLFSIKDQDLKQNGHYFQYAYDQATMFPMQQMSCKKLTYIDQMVYLYNQGTLNNDNKLNRQEQVRLVDLIKSKPKYPCHKNYF